jgi:hypothetical protein
MEDPTNNRELEKMLRQTQPDLKKIMDQIRPDLTSAFGSSKAMESLKAADSPLVQLSALQTAASQSETRRILESTRLLQAALAESSSQYLKDQIEIGSIFEKAMAQITSASEFARASSSLTHKYAAMEQFKIPPIEFPIFPNLTIPELPRIDWPATYKSHIAGVIRLADCGWTTPAWMGFPDINRLGKATEAEIDDYFIEAYLGSQEGELEAISAHLMSSVEMGRWKNLLEEIFDCIKIAKYRICVPALISILEGFTAESICKALGTSRRDVNIAASLKRTRWHEDDNLKGLLWMSLVVFLDRLFAHSDFESTTPSFINRHWILHGRSPTDWTASDTLKLVNALATVHWLFE